MFSVRVTGDKQINDALLRFSSSIRERQKHTRRLGGYVRTLARQNLRQQREIEGGSFTPRKQEKRAKRRAARRMLVGFIRDLTVWSGAGNNGVVVGWKNSLIAAIAYRHQHGMPETWTAQRSRQVYGQPDYTAPATRQMALALIHAGYRHMVPATGGGRRPKRVNARWIQQHMNQGQAGLILRRLTSGKGKGLQSWEIPLASRPFLGITSQQADELAQKFVKSLLKSARA